MTLRELVSRFPKARKVRDGFMVSCPAHADKNPSLHLSEKDGKLLVHCYAGCSTEAVLAALGIEARDLFLDASACERRVVAEYPYSDESGRLLFQVVRFEPKDFRQRRPDGKGGWAWNLNGVRRVLYRLPEVVKAKAVIICEGEKDVATARAFGLIATCNPQGAEKWRTEYADALRDKRIAIIADADEPGRKHATHVAASLFGKVETLKVLELPGAKDLAEWKEHGGTRQALVDLINAASEWKPGAIELCAELDALVVYIRRFVFMCEPQARVVVLWVAHTHAVKAADATPYLAVTSAEKQSGKTRLLEALEPVVANPWLTGRVTPAVLIRKIDKEAPTLLLDESDAAFASEKEYAEALRGVLNTGHRRGGKASCCVGQGANISFRDFSTFCPKAIAGIGKLPDTVADRAIPIRLKRAAPGERVEKFRQREVEAETTQLRGEFETWAAMAVEKLRAARPELPDQLSDRQQDGAEPLLAIADVAGGEWPEKARQALIELCAEAQAADDSAGKRLLGDIRETFNERAADRLPSAELAKALAEIETSPWGECAQGKPITAARLARMLRPFEIYPGTKRGGGKTFKGYLLEDFLDAFTRYLGPENPPDSPSRPLQSVTPSQPAIDAGASDFSDRNKRNHVTVQKCEIPSKTAPCDGVTVSSPGTGEEEAPSGATQEVDL